MSVWLMMIAGCIGDAPPPKQSSVAAPVMLSELLEQDPVPGAAVWVGPLVVTTGATPLGEVVYLQDPSDGLGLAVWPGGPLEGWPPSIGTEITMRGVFGGSPNDPIIFLESATDVSLTGQQRSLVVLENPVREPAPYALARWTDVTVMTRTDPAGRARSSVGFLLDDHFLVGLPARGSQGRLTGLVLPTGAVAPRSAEDWSGISGVDLVAETTIEALHAGAHQAGDMVQFEGIQVTPWSRGNRFVVVQDDQGLGVWIDAEGFGDGLGQAGELGRWTAEVVSSGARVRLRSWWQRELTGQGAMVPGQGEVDGAWLTVDVQDIGPPSVTGERYTAEGWVLDDRFRDIAALDDAATVSGVVRLTDGDPLLCVTSGEAVP